MNTADNEPATGIAYQYRSAEHEHSHGYLYEPVSKALGGIPAGGSLLDMGCGNGSFLSLFQDRGWELTGTDFSDTGIETAKKHFPEIRFFLADATNPDSVVSQVGSRVDAIVSTEVIEHVYDPRGFVRNVKQLLKPGGILVMSTPYHGYLKNLLLAATGGMDKHFTALWDHGHIKFWSQATLRTLLSEAGFVDIKFVGAGRLPWLWKSMVVSARAPQGETSGG